MTNACDLGQLGMTTTDYTVRGKQEAVNLRKKETDDLRLEEGSNTR